MRNKQAQTVALGGMMAALALVIMCLGGIIPVATYICPAVCMLILAAVLRLCGNRIAWAWYATVSLLCLLMAPDKESAVIFAFLGYYPIVKQKVDKLPFAYIWKLLLFNLMIFISYYLLIHLLAIDQVVSDFHQLGYVLGVVTLLLGNICLLLLDHCLTRFNRK